MVVAATSGHATTPSAAFTISTSHLQHSLLSDEVSMITATLLL